LGYRAGEEHMTTILTFFVLVSLGSGLTLLAIYCLIKLCEVK
jgi:hypothetical protein